jgi:hypothetical protein
VRIETATGEPAGFADGIPVRSPPRWTGFANLPSGRDGVTIVVSQIVGLAVGALLADRCDAVYPGTAPNDGATRRPGQRVMAVTRFIRAV